jgi:hypothetical protein
VQPVARNGLTAGQVTAIIRDSGSPEVSAGLELVDLALNAIEDLTDDFAGGSVGRSNYATLHATSTLHISRELDWGKALVRPYYLMSDGTNTARFNLGVYLTSSPRAEAGEQPVTHEVGGYDITHWLNTPVGEAYTVAAGVGYLAAAEAILIDRGILSYQIDQTRGSDVLASPRSWPFADDVTWLNIINDLLAAVGYQGLWSDWDGRLRLQPYEAPVDRATEWLYNADPDIGMLALKRAAIKDWFDVPNRWVFYWSKDPGGAAPVEGAGIYVHVNTTNGPSSVAARGRVISARPEQIDVVDQDALVAAASAKIDADMRLKTTFEADSAPNPLHWHFDKVTLADPDLGPIQDCVQVSWTLPLDGSDMSHVWALI